MPAKNPNSPISRLKSALQLRWYDGDYPGGEKRFQPRLILKDIGIFVGLPAAALFIANSCERIMSVPKKGKVAQSSQNTKTSEVSKSQIIRFVTNSSPGTGGSPGAPKRSPGTLVRVKLLNSVETYATAPVHAQIADDSLGIQLKGGTLIGDASPDSNYNRISITFKYARDPNRAGSAFSLSARALSLDGTLGLDAGKKEGFVARAGIGSAANMSQEGKPGNGADLQSLLLKALTAGLFQELGSESQIAKNRSQVLTLTPGSEFFAELTDFFTGSAR